MRMPLTLGQLICLKVLGAFFLPHGGIALDPDYFPGNATQKEQAWILHNTSKIVAKVIADLNPDVIYLSTPHGIADLNNFMFYLNAKGGGDASTEGNYAEFTIAVDMDAVLATNLAQLFRRSANVSGVTAYSSGELFPLRWGEVIPLWFIKNEMPNAKAVIMSHPTRRYNYSVAMIPELRKLGEDLYNVLENIPEKVAFVVSGDLAHTHDKDGPYGYDPSADPFDKAVGTWASTLSSDSLLVVAAGYVEKALSCGFTGSIMLEGFLSASSNRNWKPTMYANYHPTYYGMMVAEFLPSQNAINQR